MENIKLSLVTSSGILLASKPESVDDTQQILASGLISAILTYAKEMHSEELQSLSYYDRTISFVETHNFFFIVETLDEEFTLTERQTKHLLEQITLSSSSLLEGRDPDTVSEGEASLILEHCFHDINSLNLVLNRNPLQNLVPEFFTILHKNEGFVVQEKNESKQYLASLAKVIDSNIAKIDQKIKHQSFIILLPEFKKTFYVVFCNNDFTTKVGYFIIPSGMDYIVFRIFPLLEKVLEDFNKIYPEVDLKILFEKLQKFEDLGNNYSVVNLDEVSIASLFTLLKDKLGIAIGTVLAGKPLYLIGDKSPIKLLIDTLSIFNQHLSYSVLEWVRDEDLQGIDKHLLNNGILGMSSSIFQEIQPLVNDLEKIIIVNLEEESPIETISDEYFIDKLEKVKYEDTTKVSVMVFQEIKKIISMSYILTSSLNLTQEDSALFLKSQKEHSQYHENFIDIALNLAKQRNKLLNFVF